ncbi:M28 family peptidase [uncultured Roseivirga sp.]|uniref:M28 family peptidase n=1 Tax=uncultured Roseivirga sp. TaxID=543088 RepID=UPI000D793AD3|nr:M28 family peptidase [uncultured Roseivirga sp.]PWL30866.1 MAG: hypothetical protein DCO95_05140 [Roseivirga sp. XM-24bin3]
MKNLFLFLLASLTFATLSCGSQEGSSRSSSKQTELKEAPKPNADSLYMFTQKQVDFGPRVPNTEAHREAANWFVDKFEGYGAKVTVQEFTDRVYDGTEVELKNIVASFNPESKKRILLAAHWDTRPFGDKDSDNNMVEIDGANDGASGVSVLLEIARIMSGPNPPSVGVDMILFDGEDWGEHEVNGMGVDPEEFGKQSWYCLGSQYWSKNKHQANYSAYYGILLDMVGAEGATFYYDGASKQYASRTLEQTWDVAHQLGYEQYFVKQIGFSGIIDDHVFVNEIARIPMIDILDYRPELNGFGGYHHTEKDNMSIISKETLSAVAHVVLTVLYNE